MRNINVAVLQKAVRQLCIDANLRLNPDVTRALRRGRRTETNPLARSILDMTLENSVIARQKLVPLCQDTGYTVIWLAVGQDVRLTGGELHKALQAGVSQGYREGYLRKSMVHDPFDRKNTNDNTPAIIHTSIIPGRKIKITVEIKGGGSENMSRTAMLTPADGLAGVVRTVIGWVNEAGSKPCPPIIVGVGIGGDFEQCAILSKRALLRPLGSRHQVRMYAGLEARLLQEINKLNIGPQGLGGRTTALGVHIEAAPCHIACLPLAMNIDCHAHRVKSIVI
jgi:fumarate hydratase subunit alpha